MKTERISVLLSHQEKVKLTLRAAELNISVGEYLRRAATAYNPDVEFNEKLDVLASELARTANQTNAQLDRALEKTNALLAEFGW